MEFSINQFNFKFGSMLRTDNNTLTCDISIALQVRHISTYFVSYKEIAPVIP